MTAEARFIPAPPVSFQDGVAKGPSPLAKKAAARYIQDIAPRDGYLSDLSDDR
ncbi:hypothetical protein [Streptomyces sp. RK9]|uniref:hypothetical protein n=1 Tax=Streptomyces sp. RK9 TaxID=3239284 RepID=UPI00386BF8C1